MAKQLNNYIKASTRSSSISTAQLQQLSCVHCEKSRKGTNAIPNIVTASKRGWKITVHHQGPCGPCVKCGTETDKRWANETVISLAAFEAIKEVTPVSNASCICKACDGWSRRQVHALAKDKSNSLKPAEKKPRQQCCVTSFTEPMHCWTE